MHTTQSWSSPAQQISRLNKKHLKSCKWDFSGHIWVQRDASIASAKRDADRQAIQSISKHYSQTLQNSCWAAIRYEMWKSEQRNVGKSCFFCCLIFPWLCQYWGRMATPMNWFRNSSTMDYLADGGQQCPCWPLSWDKHGYGAEFNLFASLYSATLLAFEFQEKHLISPGPTPYLKLQKSTCLLMTAHG